MRKSWRVYYRKEPTFVVDQNLTMADVLSRTHQYIRTVEADTKDEVFQMMQGEIWSPNGEQKATILALHLHHTSMSVGDVIVMEREIKVDKYITKFVSLGLQCAPLGWKLVPQFRKPVVQNLGEIIGFFQKVSRAEERSIEDADLFCAPTEIHNLIFKGYDRVRNDLEKRIRENTGLSFTEISKEACQRSTGKWVYYNVTW